MADDILNPIFSYGTLEQIILLLMKNKKMSREQLQNCISKGGESITPSIDTLVNLEMVSDDEENICLNKVKILKEWDGNPYRFSLYLKLQILSSIHSSKNKNIHYLSKYLAYLFSLNTLISQSEFELLFQRSRVDSGIDEEMSITASGKLDHAKQFLKIMGILQILDKDMFITIPKDLLVLACELVLKTSKSGTMGLFPELLQKINEHYLPVLENRTTIYPIISHILCSSLNFSTEFTFEMVPDAGYAITIEGKQINSVQVI